VDLYKEKQREKAVISYCCLGIFWFPSKKVASMTLATCILWLSNFKLARRSSNDTEEGVTEASSGSQFVKP